MRTSIIARNYAETLFALAQRNGGDATVDEYGVAIEDVAALLTQEPRIREFLETPRIDTDSKKRAIRGSFAGRVPDLFLRFLLVVIEKRRGATLCEVAAAYREIVDEARGRVRARVTLAREADPALQLEIRNSLERMFGKTVLPEFEVDRSLVGGVVVRVGDRVLDGSVRNRAVELRRRLLATDLPRQAAV